MGNLKMGKIELHSIKKSLTDYTKEAQQNTKRINTMNHTPYWHCTACKCEPEIGTVAVSNYLDAEVHTVCRTFVELRGREDEDEK